MANSTEVYICWDKFEGEVRVTRFDSGKLLFMSNAKTLTEALTAIGSYLNGSTMTAHPVEVRRLDILG